MDEQLTPVFKEFLTVSQEVLALLKPIRSLKMKDKSEIVSRVKFLYKTSEHFYNMRSKEVV